LQKSGAAFSKSGAILKKTELNGKKVELQKMPYIYVKNVNGNIKKNIYKCRIYTLKM